MFVNTHESICYGIYTLGVEGDAIGFMGGRLVGVVVEGIEAGERSGEGSVYEYISFSMDSRSNISWLGLHLSFKKDNVEVILQ